jgi:hypothetical protein
MLVQPQTRFGRFAVVVQGRDGATPAILRQDASRPVGTRDQASEGGLTGHSSPIINIMGNEGEEEVRTR